MDSIKKLTAPIFKNFLPSELDYLLSISQIKIFEKKEVLIREKEIGQEFYVILEGKVVVSKQEELDKINQLATLGVGEVVGEISIITKNPRSATVTATETTKALVINITKIKQDPKATTIYEKLIQNLGIELSKKLLYFEDQILKFDRTSQETIVSEGDISEVAPTSILDLLGWRWSDIMHEVPFLAAHGYDAIKISPPQEFIVKNGDHDPWWTIYQPVSYQLSNFYGTPEEFIKMVDFCHDYDLKVYADLILNHMAEFVPQDPHLGTNGTQFSPYHYGPLNTDQDYYEYNDFYHFAKNSNRKICDEDYCKLAGVWHLEHYDLLNLPKLNLHHPQVKTILRKYVKFLLSLGIDGFRIDAAKHLNIKAVASILANLKTRQAQRPFIYQEYYTGVPIGIDIHSFLKKYFKLGYVTTFEYGSFLSEALQNKNNNLQKLVEFSFGSSWLHYPENRAITVIDNHDTERMMSNMLSYQHRENNHYVLAYIFMLAWPFGIPKIMSSFHFKDHDDPIPKTKVWQNGRFTGFEPNSPWVAQHRWDAIANMVLFHRKVQDAPGLAHIWTHGNQVAFARVKSKAKAYIYSVGFVAINATPDPLVKQFETGLPDGKYYNLIASTLTSGNLQGPTIQIKNFGKATLNIPPFDAVAVHLEFRE